MLAPVKTFLKQNDNLVELKRVTEFFYNQRIRGFVVPTLPFFDSEKSAEWFLHRLSAAKRYFEFGSGGSTYTAAKYGKPFTTVDSDPYFLDAVRRKIISDGLGDETKQRFLYRDIGLTAAWGKPITLLPPTRRRCKKFASYSDFEFGAPDTDRPDLILIDGRFRVACALKVIRALRGFHDWEMVIDDYVGRPHYAIVERFARLDCFVGRMAVFGNAGEGDNSDLAGVIDSYERDHR